MRLKGIFLLVAFLITSSFGFSQIKKGTKELSFSGTAMAVKYKQKVDWPQDYQNDGNQQNEYESDTEKIIMLFIRPGYFIFDNVAFEPEIIWTAQDGVDPALSFTGNLAYNFQLPNTQVTPFILAGYGISNGLPLNNTLFFNNTKDFDIKLLNFGAGIKIPMSKHIALRLEYRFQKYSWQVEGYLYSDYISYDTFSVDYDYTFHKILFGLAYRSM